MNPASAGFYTESLGSKHDRVGFTCGTEALDRYLRQQASQDTRSGVAAVFVLIPGNGTIAGYYTLSFTAIQLTNLPAMDAKKLPRYEMVPATLLGRLAINSSFRGQRLGAFLLLDALRRAQSVVASVASWAVIVDAKDESARTFYEHHEFRQVPDEPFRLYLPMKKIVSLVNHL